MDRVAELTLARGQAAGRGHRESGRIWGNAVQSIAQPVAQMVAAYPQMKAEQQARQHEADVERQLRAEFANGAPSLERLTQIVGPERATSIAAGFKALQPDPAKDYANKQGILRDTFLGLAALPEGVRAENYSAIRQNLLARGVIAPADAPEEYSADFWQRTVSYGQTPKAPERTPTKTISVRNADGSVTERIVEDKPGQEFTSAAPTPEKWAPRNGSATPQERLALALGYVDPTTGRPQTERLTEAQANAADRRAAAATRFVEPKTGEAQEWVIRNGQPTPIPRGTAQPGDRPYDEVAARQANSPNPAADEAKDTAREIVRIARELRNHKGFSGAFGVVSSRLPTLSQSTADAEVLRDSLMSLLTLANTGKLKGVLSNSDMELLRKASTTIAPQMGEASAGAELDRIIEKIGAAVDGMSAGGTNTTQAPPAPDGWKYVPKAGGGWTAVEAR